MDVKKYVIHDIARQSGLPSETVSKVVLLALELWSKEVRYPILRGQLNYSRKKDAALISKKTGVSKEVVYVVLQLLLKYSRLFLSSGYRIKSSHKISSQQQKSKHYTVTGLSGRSNSARGKAESTMRRRGRGEGDDPGPFIKPKKG